jgi:hypothetical protein
MHLAVPRRAARTAWTLRSLFAGGGAAIDHGAAHIGAGLELDDAVGRVVGQAEFEPAARAADGGEFAVERDRLVRLGSPALHDQHAGQNLGAADADMRSRRRRGDKDRRADKRRDRTGRCCAHCLSRHSTWAEL